MSSSDRSSALLGSTNTATALIRLLRALPTVRVAAFLLVARTLAATVCFSAPVSLCYGPTAFPPTSITMANSAALTTTPTT